MSDQFSDTLMEVIGRPVDLAVSDWFVERHGHALRHAPGLGWLAWDDQRWQPSDVQARYLAKETAAELVIAAVSAAKDAQTDMAKEAQRWSGARRARGGSFRCRPGHQRQARGRARSGAR